MGWVCNVGSLELYSIQNGSPTGMIVHQFAGTLGREFILMVDKDQVRRAREVKWFIGREYVQRMD